MTDTTRMSELAPTERLVVMANAVPGIKHGQVQLARIGEFEDVVMLSVGPCRALLTYDQAETLADHLDRWLNELEDSGLAV